MMMMMMMMTMTIMSMKHRGSQTKERAPENDALGGEEEGVSSKDDRRDARGVQRSSRQKHGASTPHTTLQKSK